ncbi:MAG TPA: alpha/beta hydrolase [Bryobacteraceae bacterium]|nr:alpha/beta hydrolase [Bryobacteraceae bacterium]
MRHAPFCLLALAPLFAQERTPDDLLKLPVPDATRIAYGTAALQFGELRVPSGRGPHPVVILVHGGCWVAKLGKLDERAVALDLVRPIAADLTASGFATWNLEYRRLGNEGGGWPGTFQDIAAGADYLRQIARKYQLDLTRVVAIGHSAGGHFALWLAARPKLPQSSELYVKDPLRIKGVVDLDGPGDLKATLPLQQPVCGAPVITQLMGGSPEERAERYREGSPIELLPLGVPQEIFAGRMFAGQTRAYVDAARRAGDAANATVAAQSGHFVFIDPGSSTWPQVVKAIRALAEPRP